MSSTSGDNPFYKNQLSYYLFSTLANGGVGNGGGIHQILPTPMGDAYFTADKEEQRLAKSSGTTTIKYWHKVQQLLHTRPRTGDCVIQVFTEPETETKVRYQQCQ